MSNFKKNAQIVRKMVDEANRRTNTKTSHDRFHYFAEFNDLGLFAFGVYDYVSKKHEMVDVFATDTDSRVARIKEIIQNNYDQPKHITELYRSMERIEPDKH